MFIPDFSVRKMTAISPAKAINSKSVQWLRTELTQRALFMANWKQEEPCKHPDLSLQKLMAKSRRTKRNKRSIRLSQWLNWSVSFGQVLPRPVELFSGQWFAQWIMLILLPTTKTKGKTRQLAICIMASFYYEDQNALSKCFFNQLFLPLLGTKKQLFKFAWQ